MKRVLIITYYWPPSGGSGVQRWLKFSKYLPDFSWKPVVYTPSNPDFKVKDKSLLKDIPLAAEIIKQPIYEPYSFYRKLFGKKEDENSSAGVVGANKVGIAGRLAKWVRGNVFVPDPRVFWRRSSTKFLKKYLKENPVDVVISTGTPHSMHLIALDLKKYYPNIPWIADFRDPWSELDMLKSYNIHPYIFSFYKSLEKQVLQNCDVCLTTSKIWAKDFERLGAQNTKVITNGFDEDDFNFEIDKYDDFVIAHFGLLNHLRNPEELWRALNELCKEKSDFNKKLKIHLGGTIDPNNIEEINKFSHLKDKVKLFPYISHEDVIKEYLKSSLLLLLLFNSDSGKGNIPGKLFEYLASASPILAFGPDYGDTAEIVEECKNGSFFYYGKSDIHELKSYIYDTFTNKKNNIPNQSPGNEKYSRKHLTFKLSEVLNKLVEK